MNWEKSMTKEMKDVLISDEELTHEWRHCMGRVTELTNAIPPLPWSNDDGTNVPVGACTVLYVQADYYKNRATRAYNMMSRRGQDDLDHGDF